MQAANQSKQNVITGPTQIAFRNFNFYYGEFLALKNINFEMEKNKVTAFIGPSGCGKSTLLRTINRMYDLYPNQRAEGEILLDGENILSPSIDLNELRSRRFQERRGAMAGTGQGVSPTTAGAG